MTCRPYFGPNLFFCTEVVNLLPVNWINGRSFPGYFWALIVSTCCDRSLCGVAARLRRRQDDRHDALHRQTRTKEAAADYCRRGEQLLVRNKQTQQNRRKHNYREPKWTRGCALGVGNQIDAFHFGDRCALTTCLSRLTKAWQRASANRNVDDPRFSLTKQLHWKWYGGGGGKYSRIKKKKLYKITQKVNYIQ